MKRLWLVVLLMVMVVAASSAAAKRVVVPREKKVVLAPFEIEGGREGARQKVPEIAQKVFEEEGFQVITGRQVEEVLGQLNIRPGFLTPKELLAVGEAFGSDYAVTARIKIKSKRVWKIIFPKAKAEATFNTLIVDVKNKKIAYDAEDLKRASQYGGEGWQEGVGLLVSWPASLFMGGKRTKEEVKVVSKTLEKAYQEFFSQSHPRLRNIE